MYQSRVRYIPFLLAIIICRHAASQAAPMALPASLPPTKSGPEIACPGGFPKPTSCSTIALTCRGRELKTG